MRIGYNPYLIKPLKKNWLYIIQFQINKRGGGGGARQNPLKRPTSPRLKKEQTEPCMHAKSGIYLYFYSKIPLTL